MKHKMIFDKVDRIRARIAAHREWASNEKVVIKSGDKIAVMTVRRK